jgi:hypothetical protein
MWNVPPGRAACRLAVGVGPVKKPHQQHSWRPQSDRDCASGKSNSTAGSLRPINSSIEIFDKCRTPIKIASILADTSCHAKRMSLTSCPLNHSACDMMWEQARFFTAIAKGASGKISTAIAGIGQKPT